MTDLIAQLESEAQKLILPRFDETVALDLGMTLVRLAAGKPVVINIRSANRVFFHAAMPGSAPLNDLWARRKSNTALMFQEASFLIVQRQAAKKQTLDQHGLSNDDFADSGGAVPIRVAGVGVVAVATVSGLPQAEDHALVVSALRDILSNLAG